MSDADKIKNFSKELVLELSALQEIGVNVPKKVFNQAKDLKIVKEYALNNSITIEETADLLISLAR